MKKGLVLFVSFLTFCSAFAQQSEDIKDYFMPKKKIRVAIVDKYGRVDESSHIEEEFWVESGVKMYKKEVYMSMRGETRCLNKTIMELKITKSTVEIINSQVVGFGGDALSKGTVLLKLPVAGASNRWKNPGDELVYSVKMENFDGEKMLTLTQTHPRWGNSVDYYAKGRGYLYTKINGRIARKAVPTEEERRLAEEQARMKREEEERKRREEEEKERIRRENEMAPYFSRINKAEISKQVNIHYDKQLFEEAREWNMLENLEPREEKITEMIQIWGRVDSLSTDILRIGQENMGYLEHASAFGLIYCTIDSIDFYKSGNKVYFQMGHYVNRTVEKDICGVKSKNGQFQYYGTKSVPVPVQEWCKKHIMGNGFQAIEYIHYADDQYIINPITVDKGTIKILQQKKL